jgi:hypothetical protein
MLFIRDTFKIQCQRNWPGKEGKILHQASPTYYIDLKAKKKKSMIELGRSLNINKRFDL